MTRIELDDRSHCSDPIPTKALDPTETCWSQSFYEKVILIVIDGLRFDSVVDMDQNHEVESKPLHVAKFPKLTELSQLHLVAD